MKSMSERQKRFADYYVETGNARRAAIRAGFTPNYACKLKKMPLVAEYIKTRLQAMDRERIASGDAILKYLTDVMEGKNGESDELRMSAAKLLDKRLQMLGAQ